MTCAGTAGGVPTAATPVTACGGAATGGRSAPAAPATSAEAGAGVPSECAAAGALQAAAGPAAEVAPPNAGIGADAPIKGWGLADGTVATMGEVAVGVAAAGDESAAGCDAAAAGVPRWAAADVCAGKVDDASAPAATPGEEAACAVAPDGGARTMSPARAGVAPPDPPPLAAAVEGTNGDCRGLPCSPADAVRCEGRRRGITPSAPPVPSSSLQTTAGVAGLVGVAAAEAGRGTLCTAGAAAAGAAAAGAAAAPPLAGAAAAPCASVAQGAPPSRSRTDGTPAARPDGDTARPLRVCGRPLVSLDVASVAYGAVTAVGARLPVRLPVDRLGRTPAGGSDGDGDRRAAPTRLAGLWLGLAAARCVALRPRLRPRLPIPSRLRDPSPPPPPPPPLPMDTPAPLALGGAIGASARPRA